MIKRRDTLTNRTNRPFLDKRPFLDERKSDEMNQDIRIVNDKKTRNSNQQN